MTERSVKVTLRANVADFKAQLAQASKSLEDVAKAGDKTGKVAETSLGRLAQSAQLQREQWATVSNGLLGYSAVSAAAVGVVVKSYADFDEAMSGVSAATHESAANMQLLREAAIQAGADTAYSATEAADAIEALAKAGVSTTDILNGGLSGALDLAASDGLAVGEAAEIAATALTQFKLRGDQTAHVADLLAAGAGKAQGGVHDLGMALKQSGLVASQTGLSIEETTGALAAFASAGLIGSDAGTSFKTMLQRLTPQSTEAKRVMDELGISAYDAQGNFIGLEAFAGQLKTAMSGLSAEQRQAAMNTIFGADAVRAASVLYEQGAEGIAEWTEKVNDSGYAAQTAAKRLDNLKGDLEKLTGSLETLFLKSGSSANKFLRNTVQAAEKVVDTFGALPRPVQEGTLALAALTAVGAGVAGVGMKMVTAFVDFRTAVASLDGAVPLITRISEGMSGLRGGLAQTKNGITGFGQAWVIARANGVSSVQAIGQAATPILGGVATAARGAGSALLGAFGGPIGLAVTAGIAAISFGLSAYAEKQEEARSRAEAYAETLDKVSGALTSATRNQVTKNLSDDGAIKAYKALGGSAKDYVDAALGVADAEKRVAETIEKARSKASQGNGLAQAHSPEMRALAQNADKASEAIAATSEQISTARERTRELAEANGETAGSESDLAASVDGTTSSIDKQTDALGDLVESLSKAYGIVLSARDAQRQFEESIDSASEALEKNGQTLDITTEAGRANQAALDDIAKSGWRLVEALQAQGATEEELQASMSTTRDAFIRAAEAMGMEQAEAEALADKLGLIPSDVTTTVTAPGADTAKGQLDAVKLAADNIPTSKTVGVYVTGSEHAYNQLMSVRKAMASIGGSTHIAMGVGGVGGSTAYATGGAVIGPGSGTSDSIVARLSNGEHVLTASDVSKLGGQSGVYRLRDAIQSGRVPAFASGGAVGASAAVAYLPERGAVSVEMPKTMVVVDTKGEFMTQFKVAAKNEAIRVVKEARL